MLSYTLSNINDICRWSRVDIFTACLYLFVPAVPCLVLKGYVSRALALQKSARFKDRDGGASDVAVLNAS